MTESKPKLLDQLRSAIQMRRYSMRTEKAYVRWVKRFVRFHQLRHPAEMGVREIREFLTWLAVERKVAASTQDQARSALLFLYREVLRQPLRGLDGVAQAKGERKMPVVLSQGKWRRCSRSSTACTGWWSGSCMVPACV